MLALRSPSPHGPARYTRRMFAESIRASLRLRKISLAAAVAVATFALDLACLLLSRPQGGVAAIWPSDGLALGLMLASRLNAPRTVLAASFLGVVASDLAWGDTLLNSAGLAGANVIGLALAYAAMRAGAGRLDLKRARHLVLLLVLSAAAAAVSAGIAAAWLAVWVKADAPAIFRSWLLADLLGYIIVAPLVHAVLAPGWMSSSVHRGREAAVLGAYCVLTLAVFWQRQYPLLFLAPLGLFVVAYVAELRGAVLAVMLTTVVAVTASALHRGPISLVTGGPGDRLLILQLFLASLTVAILPISAAMAERRELAISLARARDVARAEARRASEAVRSASMAEEIGRVGHWRRAVGDTHAYISPTLRELYGFAPEDEPSNEQTPGQYHPDDREAVRSGFQDVTEDGQPRMIECRLIAPQPRHLRLYIAGERDETGELIAIFGMARDITEAKMAEAALREARAAAESAALERSAMLADLSHELRTPLASVLGFASLLRDTPELNGEARRLADGVTIAGEGLLAVVENVLVFSSLESAPAAQLRAASPLALVEDTLLLFQSEAAAKGLTLEAEALAGAPQSAILDAGRIRQVLLNLVGNAIKYTETGGVKITLALAGDSQLRFEVCDSGPGLSPDHAGDLFKRFSRLDAGEGRPSGVGLGLAITKALVEGMGGEIGVRGGAVSGSCFWFTTPMRAAAPAPAWVGDGRRALIADDVEISRALMRRSLEPLGFEVTEAVDGEAAAAQAAAAAFELVVLDIDMPALDGLAAAERIRQDGGASSRAMMLAVSAQPLTSAFSARLQDAGFDGFLPKPFTPRGFAELVSDRWPQATCPQPA